MTTTLPPIPDTVGTRVKDADGDFWTRDAVGWARPGIPMRVPLDRLAARFGPLVEVLAAVD